MTYVTVNGCTHPPCKQQIITIILYLSIVCLHSIYVVPGIATISHSILYVLLGLNYISLIIIIYDYIWITVHDPVDRVVLDPQLLSTIPLYKLQDCQICGKRQIDSYHCKKCGRCTEDFDHHCKFLNNCIGRRNYQHFLRLLSVNMIFLPLVIGQSVWVFVRARQDQYIRESIPKNQWVILGIIFISVILLLLQSILLGFHCYISCLDMTTLGYIRKEDQHNYGNRDSRYQSKLTGDKLKQFRNSIIEYENEQPRQSNQPQSSSRNLNPGDNGGVQQQRYNPERMGVSK